MNTAKGALIRCFVAVEIPEPIQALLKPVQTHLQPQIHKRTSWTKHGNFHLTLKFLGDVHPEAIHEVSESLQRVTDTYAPFSIGFGGIGAFPNLARPRVIWMGIKQGASPVSRLAKAVNLRIETSRFPNRQSVSPTLNARAAENRDKS